MNSFRCSPIVRAMALVAVMTPSAYGADINFNGFASIRATAADADGPSGRPFSDLKGNGDFSFEDESLFAIQASADLGDGLSATIQLMAEGRNDFEVEAEWAYLSYQLNDSHRLSAGRFANPIFFQSQYENVGYAHNYARLPRAVYVGFDFSTVEGIALDSTFDVGGNTLETKLLYGNWSGDTYFGAVDRDESWGLDSLVAGSATLSGDWWKVFAGILGTEIDGGTLDDAFFTVIRNIGGDAAVAAGAATQSELELLGQAVAWDGRDGLYWYAGFNAEHNNIIFELEYADYQVEDSSDAPNQAYYYAVGYRFDSGVIMLHYEENEQDTDFTFLSETTNPTLRAIGEGYQTGVATDFDAWGVDVRYDFHSSAAFKAGYVTGEHSNPAIGDYDILSVGVDVVF